MYTLAPPLLSTQEDIDKRPRISKLLDSLKPVDGTAPNPNSKKKKKKVYLTRAVCNVSVCQ